MVLNATFNNIKQILQINFFNYKSLINKTCYMYKPIGLYTRAPTTLKSEGEVTSLSGADKREVRDNREKW